VGIPCDEQGGVGVTHDGTERDRTLTGQLAAAARRDRGLFGALRRCLLRSRGEHGREEAGGEVGEGYLAWRRGRG
jgi:hypothetical protein